MDNTFEKENEITQRILGCAFEVHTALGRGLLESAYRKCLAYELQLNGLEVIQERKPSLNYKGLKIELGYRLDLMVNELVIVELKAVDAITDVHIAQLLTYLKLTDLHVGLLLNFNVTSLKNGIKRVVN